MNSSLYVPRPAMVLEATQVTATETYFRVQLDAPLGHRPGQFIMVSILGLGEAPISISSGPKDDLEFEMVIRNAGSLTQALCAMQAGSYMGIRGPFGSGFELEDLKNKDILFVCGGLGLVPLRSLIQAVLAQPERYGTVTILSGCRTPADELYRDDLSTWGRLPGVEVIRTVDRTEHQPWQGQVGLVTAPLEALNLDPERTVAALCGPPVMYKFVLMSLLGRGLDPSRIYVDLERRMRCGVGKCGHCQINHTYCCQDGPVFRVSDLDELPEALQ